MSTYQEIGEKKREERSSKLIKEWLIPEDKLSKAKDVLKFPVESGYLSKEEIEITESSAPVIVKKIADKEWTSYKVTSAFCHRSQIAHQLVNCLSEILYKEALETAKELDEYYAKTGKLKGPLHGLPVSLKDNINIKGVSSSIGFVDWALRKEKEDSAITVMLRDLGAVFYCKTNVPVAMMMPESKNHVFGATTNPYNRLLSAGGSSGGAAAQAALKGSCIEIGSDIGGSIRVPASFEGLYALRPTFGRFPTYGTRSGLPGLESVNSVNGPLCANLDSLEFYLKTMADGDPSLYDPKCLYRPWQPVSLPEKLNFAIVYDDGIVKPTPPITRGLKIVEKLLTEAGHEVIKWDTKYHYRLHEINEKFFVADGGKHVLAVTRATGEPLFSYMARYGESPEIGVSELWDLQSERTGLAKKFLQQWLDTAQTTKNGRPIDAIIIPATPFPGSPLEKFGKYVGYTSVFNSLDYSVGVVPVTRADSKVDVAGSIEARNESEKYIWDNYDPVESEGGSVSVQIACRHGEDEKAVALMRLLAGYIGYEA